MRRTAAKMRAKLMRTKVLKVNDSIATAGSRSACTGMSMTVTLYAEERKEVFVDIFPLLSRHSDVVSV